MKEAQRQPQKDPPNKERHTRKPNSIESQPQISQNQQNWSQVVYPPTNQLFQQPFWPFWPYWYWNAVPQVPPPAPPMTEASTSARQAEANPAGNPSPSRSHMTRRDLNLCQDCSILPCIMFWQSSRFQPQHRFRSIKLWRYSHCELLHNSFAHRLSPHGCVGGIMDCCAFDMWQRIYTFVSIKRSPSPSSSLASSSSSSAKHHQSISNRA